MKICHLTPHLFHGGLAKYLFDLTAGLSEHVAVSVIAEPHYRNQFSSRVNFIPLNLHRSRNNPTLLWDILNIARSEKFDIMHAHLGKNCRILRRLKSFIPAAVVATAHTDQTGKARTYRGLSHVISVSQGAKALIDSIVPSTVVYNGLVPPSVESNFEKQQLCELFNLNPEIPLFCSIGRLEWSKGFDLLIDAFQGINANLLIIGEGTFRLALERQIEMTDQTARIKLTGQRNDVPRLMAATDGVLIPSRTEGFSYVFAEAMLLQKRVLSTDVPAVNEFIHPELIMPKSSQGMSQHLTKFLSDFDRWDSLVSEVHKNAGELFSLDSMIRGTLDVYRSIIPATAN